MAKQTKFYFDYNDAIAIRKIAIERLVGRSWKPFHTEVVDMIVEPNEDTTYHLKVIFRDGNTTTLYQFLEKNGMHISTLRG